MNAASGMTRLLTGIAAAAFLACAGGGEQTAENAQDTATAMDEARKVEHVAVGEYVNPEDSLPHIRYFESGMVSINRRCPVRKVRLGVKMQPAWVNSHPVGFC